MGHLQQQQQQQQGGVSQAWHMQASQQQPRQGPPMVHRHHAGSAHGGHHMAGILIFLFIYVLTQKYQHHSGHTPNPTPHRQTQTQHCPSTPLGGLHWLGHRWGQQGQPGGAWRLTPKAPPPSCSTWGNVSMIFKSRLPHMLILLPPPSCRPSSPQSCMEGSLLLGHTPLNPTQAPPPVASTNTRQKRSLKMDTLMKHVY